MSSIATQSVVSLAKKLTLLAFAASMWANAPAAQADDKYASIVIDVETKQVLHDRFADSPRYPASLTKVMTLYMAFDALKSGELSLTEDLPVSRAASQAAPSKLGLAQGSTIKVEDAILALVTKSANDVAMVLGERLGGSESRFAALMTVKARALGMNDTRFYNASGLPDARQISTARDLATLASHMMEDHAEYYSYFSTASFKWGASTYRNHNRLLGSVEGVDGIKTGYTRASGYNLMASAVRNDHRVIAIMLGGSTSKARNEHVTDLLEAAFTAISMTSPEAPDLRTRIAFQAIQNPDGTGAEHTALLNALQLEQGSRVD